MFQTGNGLELDGNAAFVLGELIHTGDLSFRFKQDLRILLVQMYLYRVTYLGRSVTQQIGAMSAEVLGLHSTLKRTPAACKMAFPVSPTSSRFVNLSSNEIKPAWSAYWLRSVRL